MKKQFVGTLIYAMLGVIIPFFAESFIPFAENLLLTQIIVILCSFMIGVWSGVGCALIISIVFRFIIHIPPDNESFIAMMLKLVSLSFLICLNYELLPKKVRSIYINIFLSIIVSGIILLICMYLLEKNDVFRLGLYLKLSLKKVLGILLAWGVIPPIVFSAKLKRKHRDYDSD